MKFLPSLQDLGYSAEEAEAALVDDPRAVMVWEGGEEAAWVRLQKWIFDDNHLKDYRDIQNGMLGEGYSSKLSPWIARGCISVRRIRSEVQRYEAERRNNHGTYWFHNLLEWRDRMIWIARSQGDRIFKIGGIAGDRYSWPWHGTKEDLQAWKDGRTGEAVVDAGMKELLLTGYMSMRARHIVATYLIYDLGVDWRHGAAHFEEHLLDYDPALNWCMWMQAPGLLGRGGRHQGLLHFSVKKSVALQKKQLSNHAPDRAYIQHWLVDNRRNVATNTTARQAAVHKQHTSGQRAVLVQGGSFARDDKEEDRETKAKRWARMERFSEHLPVQFPDRVSKGKGKHRAGEPADGHFADDVASSSKKSRWRKKD
jgi:deoxyribodipyrimidine photo-lyase